MGENGVLIIGEKSLTIHRNPKSIKVNSKGDKRIPYSSITSVQLTKAEDGFWGGQKGFIQLSIQGGNERQGGIVAAENDENSVVFSGEEKNIEFTRAQEVIENRIHRLCNPESIRVSIPAEVPVAPPINAGGSLDDLEKLASFMERGIITEKEFQAKKRQILGL